jgi:adenylate cyclase
MALEPSTGLVRLSNAGLSRNLALAIGSIGLVLAFLPPVAELEQRFGLQWLFNLRGPRPAPNEIVMLAINSETTDTLDLPEKPALWSRDLHTRAIERLREAGAAVIVFDLFFEESRPQDQLLADAIGRAGNVVLIKKLVAESEAQQSATSILQQAALANAPFVLPRESVRVDGFWTFKSSADNLPTLPVAALQIYAGRAYNVVRASLTGLQGALEADLPAAIGSSTDISRAAKALRKTLAEQPDLLARSLAKSRRTALCLRKRRDSRARCYARTAARKRSSSISSARRARLNPFPTIGSSTPTAWAWIRPYSRTRRYSSAMCPRVGATTRRYGMTITRFIHAPTACA